MVKWGSTGDDNKMMHDDVKKSTDSRNIFKEKKNGVSVCYYFALYVFIVCGYIFYET